MMKIILTLVFLISLLICPFTVYAEGDTIDLHGLSVAELDDLTKRINLERKAALDFDNETYELLEADYNLLLMSSASSDAELKHPFWGLDKKRERSCYQIWGDCSIKYGDGSKLELPEARVIYWFDFSISAYRHVAFITKSQIVYFDSSLLSYVEEYIDQAIIDRLVKCDSIYPTDDKQRELFLHVVYPDLTINSIITQYEGKPVSELLPVIESFGYDIILLDNGHEVNDIDPTKYYVYFGSSDAKRKEIRIPLLSEYVMLELNGYEQVLDHRLPRNSARRFAEKYVDGLYDDVSFAGYYPYEVMVSNDRYDTWQLSGKCKINGAEMQYKILVTGLADNPIIQDIKIEPIE